MRLRPHPLAVVISLSVLVGSGSLPSRAVDKRDMDTKTNPAIDFFRYANGGWLDRSKIAADRSEVTANTEVDDLLNSRLLALLKAPADVPSSDASKAAALFRQGMDTQARDKAGLAPIASYLSAIKSATTIKALNQLMEKYPLEGFGLFGSQVSGGPDDPTKSVLLLGGPRLGLFTRDLYLATDTQTKQVQAAYRDNNAKLLVLGGYSSAQATAAAKAAYDLEYKLAELQLDSRKLEADYTLANNPRTLAQLAEMYDLVDWKAMLTTAGMSTLPSSVIVTELGYYKGLKAILNATPPSTLQTLFAIQEIRGRAATLSTTVETTVFEFNGKIMQGALVPEPLEKRISALVNQSLADAVGQAYVAKYFPPAAKTKITELTNAVLGAFGKRIDATTWMSAATKQKAKAKLAKVAVNVGYPNRWNSAADVTIGATFADSVRSAEASNLKRELAKVGKPVDNSNWGPVVWNNAFYNPSNNSINFPAGGLLPPFFDPAVDAATNYGGIGAIIGHELTHGFDLGGSQFDGDGRLTSWWTDADRKAFVALNDRVVKQYNEVTALDNLKVDGQLTVGENVADIGGLAAAYDAFAARENPAATSNGLTNQQRFFLAFSASWRAKFRPEKVRTLLKVDVHAPQFVRAVQPMRNMNEFFSAFSIAAGTPMYVAPADRLRVW